MISMDGSILSKAEQKIGNYRYLSRKSARKQYKKLVKTHQHQNYYISLEKQVVKFDDEKFSFQKPECIDFYDGCNDQPKVHWIEYDIEFNGVASEIYGDGYVAGRTKQEGLKAFEKEKQNCFADGIINPNIQLTKRYMYGNKNDHSIEKEEIIKSY